MKIRLLICLVFVVLSITNVKAFNLRPETKIDGQIIVLKEENFREWLVSDLAKSIVSRFSEPVHEIITNKAWGCKSTIQAAKADEDECSPRKITVANFVPPAVMAGVQWNDNPYFQLLTTDLSNCRGRYIWLSSESVCWALVFKKGEKDARNGKLFNLQSEDVLLLRSHFGDLQFLHAMRSGDSESPIQTQAKILMWAEFMWNGVLGKYSRGTTIANVNVPGLEKYFYPSDTIQRIFFRGNPVYVDEFPLFALGSLLHMVEDSFSNSHVIREREGASGRRCKNSEYYQPARIISFENYAKQSSHEHAKSDAYISMSSGAVHEATNVIAVVEVLRQMFDKKSEWATEVKPYLECVFEIVP